MILVLKCPKCKADMKYQSRTAVPGSKRKRCVYCGTSFKAADNVVRNLQ